MIAQRRVGSKVREWSSKLRQNASSSAAPRAAHAGHTVKVDRTTLFGNPFSAEQHGRTGALRMFELWMEWKLPPGSFPDHAMAMLMTKRQMALERLPTESADNG
jgi:hypothetical protein